MNKKKGTGLTEWFENVDLGEELLEAKRRGSLVVTHPGQNPVEAIIRHMEAKKKISVGMRLSLGVVQKVKIQAAAAGVPWTSYMGAIVERAVSEPQTHCGVTAK